MRGMTASSFPQQDEYLELHLTGLSHDGRCVARREGEPVVFVRGGLPGQRVLAVSARGARKAANACWKRNLCAYSRPCRTAWAANAPRPASMRKTAEAAPGRLCPYAVQLAWKERLLADALTRIGRLRLPQAVFRPIIPSSSEWGFRNKMEFAFAPGANAAPPGAAAAQLPRGGGDFRLPAGFAAHDAGLCRAAGSGAPFRPDSLGRKERTAAPCRSARSGRRAAG